MCRFEALQPRRERHRLASVVKQDRDSGTEAPRVRSPTYPENEGSAKSVFTGGSLMVRSVLQMTERLQSGIGFGPKKATPPTPSR